MRANYVECFVHLADADFEGPLSFLWRRFTVYFATILTFVGGLIRFVSTLPGLSDRLSLDSQYYMAIVAQAINGMGIPIAVSVTTKVRVRGS